MPRRPRVPLPWEADLYLQLFERAFDRDCDPVVRARAVEVMEDLVPSRRGQKPPHRGLPSHVSSMGDLIRDVLHDRLDP